MPLPLNSAGASAAGVHRRCRSIAHGLTCVSCAACPVVLQVDFLRSFELAGFVLIGVNANNWWGAQEVLGRTVPEFVELSYINRDVRRRHVFSKSRFGSRPHPCSHVHIHRRPLSCLCLCSLHSATERSPVRHALVRR